MEITEFDRIMAAGALEEQAARLADRANRGTRKRGERNRLMAIAAERRAIAARLREGINPADLQLLLLTRAGTVGARAQLQP